MGLGIGILAAIVCAAVGLSLFVDGLCCIGWRSSNEETTGEAAKRPNLLWLRGLLLLIVGVPASFVAGSMHPLLALGFFSAVLGVAFVVVGGLRGFLRWRRAAALGVRATGVHRMWLCGVLMLVVAPLLAVLGARMPELCIARVAERGDRIMAALRRYEADHGQAPQDLEQLVPTYLAEVPGTGYFGFASWYYSVSGQHGSVVASIDENPLDFDEFRHDPDDEPHFGYRQRARHGDWVFLDD